MKYIAIDYGLKRVGLAISDFGGQMAFAKEIIVRRTRVEFFEKLLKFIEEEQTEAIVVGLALEADGTKGLIATQTTNFIASLRRRTSLPIYIIDEYLSSFAAKEDLKACRLNAKKTKELLDAQAAAHILDSFLQLNENDKEKLKYD